MKSIISIVVAGVMLSGCWGVKSGTRTTTVYDRNTNTSTTITEEVAIGDGDTVYSDAVQSVAASKSEAVASQVNGLVQLAKPVRGESEAAGAYRIAMLAVILGNVSTGSAAEIAAIKKPTTGWDVANSAVGAAGGMVKYGALAYGADTLFKNLGRNISVTGDGNQVTTEETSTSIIAGTTGDGSPIDIDSKTGGKAGDSDSTSEDEELGPECEPDQIELGKCESIEPENCEGDGTFHNGDWWYTPGDQPAGVCGCYMHELKEC